MMNKVVYIGLANVQ